MKSNRIRRVALLALAALACPLPSRAQTPDAKAGAVIVETQRPPPRPAPRPSDAADRAIIVVGGRTGRHVATPTNQAGTTTTATTATTATTKASPPPRSAGNL